MLPDPFDVLEATLGPDARTVGLDDVRVVRTAARNDHAPGNAVHRLAPLGSDEVPAALADLRERFPVGRARLLAPLGDGPAPAVPAGVAVSTLDVLLREVGAGTPPPRRDLDVALPSDDRMWHGITVLHRHAAGPGGDRARGADDERLRWLVDGWRRLVGEGRARVLRAARFGTPVAAGILHWAPGLPVDGDHAGLAVVSDVVVHPAHRGLGVGRTLADALAVRHLVDFPQARVAALLPSDGPVPHAVPRGWRRHTTLLVLTPAPDGPDEPHR